MTCAWKELLAVLPLWMRKEVDMQDNGSLREIRLRINSPPELVLPEKSLWLERKISREDLEYTVNVVSRYSPWAAATVSRGYITARGGHRIGLCGEAIMQKGEITSIGTITSLCIRVAADFPGIAAEIPACQNSILILGAPGWGKTTLLRDLIRQISHKDIVCVVDERGELFPPGIEPGKRMDVLSGCDKKTAYEPKHYQWTRFLGGGEFEEKIQNCDLLLTHSGVGTILTGKELGKTVLVYPRSAKYGEHVDDHQWQIAREFRKRDYVLICEEAEQMLQRIEESKSFSFRPLTVGENVQTGVIRGFLRRKQPVAK